MIESYIAIEGPIGVGKTSLAEIIADKLNTRKVLEKFKDNPFLEGFYDDPDANAFQTQVFFLLQRYQQQQKEIRQLKTVKIWNKMIMTIRNPFEVIVSEIHLLYGLSHSK